MQRRLPARGAAIGPATLDPATHPHCSRNRKLVMHDTLFSLDNRVAIVTGASRGIGHTIAVALASAGARLALVGRDATTLDAAVKS